MMVVDASAAAALIFAEPEQEMLAEKLAASPERAMSSISYTELVMVLSRLHPDPKFIADGFMRDMQVIPVAIVIDSLGIPEGSVA